MTKVKPVIVYLHRYPPEIEAQQWPALTALAAALAPRYDLVYCCMGPCDGVRDPTLRRDMRVIEMPFTVDQANGRDKWLKTLRWYRHLKRIVSCIRDVRADAVICKETLPFIPGRIAKLGVPTIVETSDWWWSILLGGTSLGRWIAGKLEAWEVRTWNKPNVRATVGTHAEGRLLAARGLSPENIVVINAPRNPGIFRPLDVRPSKADLGLDERHVHVALFGIIRPGKGYDQLLDWWKTAVSRHADWRLVIIGGAGGEQWCRRQISRRGLESVTHMTGWLRTKEELNRWLNAMDVLVAHRRNSIDNQGIIPSSLSNGLSTGRPVVVTGLPGMAEIVCDGVNGFLFAPDDCESFIRTLERVVRDPVAAADVGRAGMARAAECFDVQRTVGKHVALLQELLGTPEVGITGTPCMVSDQEGVRTEPPPR